MNRIRKLRNRLGLSQEKLGKELGLSQQTINNYEKELREPKLKTWEKLAEFYDVSVEYLMGLSNDPTPPEKRNPSLERIPPATGLDFNDGSPSYVATPKISYKQLLSSISALTAMNPGFTDELTKWELNEKLNACNEKEATALIQKIQRLLLDEFDM